MAAGLGSVLGGQVFEAVMFSAPRRAIGLIVPNVIVEEVHQDALGITGYPVETGATKTDHSFKLPARLEMTVGWSNSTAGYTGYVQEIYRELLKLQATRMPFNIFTGKRMYPSMLLEGIINVTSEHTENAMLPRLAFRELQISRTRSASDTAAKPGANNADQTMPQKTGSVVDQGAVQPQLVNFTGNSATAFGGYDPSLAIGPATSAGSLGGLVVDGVGTFDNSLGETLSTSDPAAFGGNAGLFGRYTPSAFADAKPFRI